MWSLCKTFFFKYNKNKSFVLQQEDSVQICTIPRILEQDGLVQNFMERRHWVGWKAVSCIHRPGDALDQRPTPERSQHHSARGPAKRRPGGTQAEHGRQRTQLTRVLLGECERGDVPTPQPPPLPSECVTQHSKSVRPARLLSRGSARPKASTGFFPSSRSDGL